jgi:hypothetical protein
MHSFARDFNKTIYMSAPVAGRSLCPRAFTSYFYFLIYVPLLFYKLPITHRLPFAMSLAGLKMYCYGYGNKSDDGRPDEVPNSGSDNDTPQQADPVQEEHRVPKKLKILSLCSPVDGNESYGSSLHTPAQKSKLDQPFTAPRSQKEYEIPASDPESSDRDQLFPDSPGGASADSSVSTVSGKR